MLTDAEYARLRDDIARHGQLQPIWICESLILDGRNRYRACIELGLDPVFSEYAGAEPVAFAWSMNGARRHLTPSQLAAAGANMLPMLEEEARKRQGTRADLTSSSHDDEVRSAGEIYGKSTEKAAEIVGSSPASVGRAAYVKKRDPAMFARIEAGEITANAAYKALRAGVRIPPPPRTQPREKRAEDIRALAESGHTSAQISERLSTSVQNVRKIARDFGLTLPDAHIGRVNGIDPRRILESTIHGIEGYTIGLAAMGSDFDVPPEDAAAWGASIDQFIATLKRLRKRLTVITNGNK